MTLLRVLEVNQTLHTLALKVTQLIDSFLSSKLIHCQRKIWTVFLTWQFCKNLQNSFLKLLIWATFISRFENSLSWVGILFTLFNQNNKLPYEFCRMLKCTLWENTTLTNLFAQVLFSTPLTLLAIHFLQDCAIAQNGITELAAGLEKNETLTTFSLTVFTIHLWFLKWNDQFFPG